MMAAMASVPVPEPYGGPAGAAPGTTRERLLAAASEVFERQGYEGARLQDIARAGGLTTGAVYANFRGKADLLYEAIDARAGAELDGMLAGSGGGEARRLLEVLGDRLVEPRAGVSLLLDAVVAARRDDDLGDALRARVDARERLVAELVGRGADEGALDPGVDTDAFARFCLTLAMGALVLRTLRVAPPDPAAWHDLISRLLDAVSEEESHE